MAESVWSVPTAGSVARWRSIRTAVLGGERQGHIAVLGDSISYGAAETGATPPKPVNNLVGRLRARVDARCGPAGTGIVSCEADKLANPSWDPRWEFGPGVTAVPEGLFRAGAYQVSAGGRLSFTARCDSFAVHHDGRLHPGSLLIDGRPAAWRRRPAGRWPAQAVDEASVPELAEHTLTIAPSGQQAVLRAVEGRIRADGTFRVSEAARSGMAHLDLFSRPGFDDPVDGAYGLAMIDLLAADLLVIQLGINDWQACRTPEQIVADVRTVIRRQRSTAPGAPGGDALVMLNPEPDLSVLGHDAAPLAQVYQAYHRLSETEEVALLDLSDRWGGFAQAQADGWFADEIHPGDAGSDDLAGELERAIFAGG